MDIKNKEQIAIMQEGGHILHEIIQAIKKASVAGVSTWDLDVIASDECKRYGVKAGTKGYYGFPASFCSCVNDTVVHGIPSKTEILKDGDVFTIDMVVIHKGLYTDAAITIPIGTISPQNQHFLDTVKKARDLAISKVKDGVYVGDISAIIEYTVRSQGFSPVKEMTGHGIGKTMHETPYIPCFGFPGTGPRLKAGQTVAIEAIIAMGKGDITISKADGWTAKTKDGSIAAVFEHTVAVLQNGCKILT